MNRLLVVLVLVGLSLSPLSVAAQQATPIGVSDADPNYVASPALIQRGDVSTLFGQYRNGPVGIVRVLATNDPMTWVAVVQNNTNVSVNAVELSASFSTNGTVTALGTTSDVLPVDVRSHGIGFAVVTLTGQALAANQVPDVKVTRAETTKNSQRFGVRIVSAVVNDQATLVGFTNTESSYLPVRHLDVLALCLASDASFGLTSYAYATLGLDPQVEAGESTTVSTAPPKECGDQYIIAVAGHVF